MARARGRRLRDRHPRHPRAPGCSAPAALARRARRALPAVRLRPPDLGDPGAGERRPHGTSGRAGRGPADGAARSRLRHGGGSAPRGLRRHHDHERRTGEGRQLRLRLRPLAAQALSRPARRSHLPDPAGGLLLRPPRGGRRLCAAPHARLDRLRRRGLRPARPREPRLQGRPRPPRAALRSRRGRARGERRERRPHPGVPGQALPRPGHGPPPRDAGLPVREHVERGLPDRPPSRPGRRVAGGGRLGPRLQARPRGGPARVGPDRAGTPGEPRFALTTKKAERRREVY